MKTPIVYYGGKQRLFDRIISLVPSHTIYCEPFVGGGAVFMEKPRSKTEIINDLDGMIAIFYRVMKNDFESLQKRIFLRRKIFFVHFSRVQNRLWDAHQHQVYHRVCVFWTVYSRLCILDWVFTRYNEQSYSKTVTMYIPMYFKNRFHWLL